jgi:CubicO group peptidase (beta-lactamase class C family)
MKRSALLLVLVHVLGIVAKKSGDTRPWEKLDAILEAGIAARAYPGVVAVVADKTDTLYAATRGTFTYGDAPAPATGTNPRMTLATVFDMASVSKVMGPTAAAAVLYQRGLLDLDSRVASWLPGYEAEGKGSTTVRHLLLHNAGLPCDPTPGYWQKVFGCPESAKASPELAFTCRDKCYRQLLEQKLIDPIGTKYRYCDECLMIAAFVVGAVVQRHGLVAQSELWPGCPLDTDGWQQCYYEAFVRRYVFAELGLTSTMYVPPFQAWWNIAPTENDTWYRGRVVQGQIHDENTYAMGGIAGHAGVFSTAGDLVQFARRWLFASPTDSVFINSTTAKAFVTIQNKTQSSRAIGWNTNDPEARGWGDGGMCGTLSPRTFLHTGFTGTMLCADPDRGIAAVLLANRIYTTRDNNKIDKFRQDWSTMVQKIFDTK